MFLPIRTDCPPHRRPTVNTLLIVVNVAVFVAVHYEFFGPYTGQIDEATALDCAAPQLYQFLTYAFRHADWGHLLGNMYFLYIFGNSLNDKLGHLKYVLFYLASAIFVGAAYCLTNDTLMLGASGAIAAVTTGFLVLFPRSRVLVLYVLFFIGTFETSSLVIIGFKMILFDNIIAPSIYGAGHVAHEAHLAGYLFGFSIPLMLLAIRALPRDQFDILALWARMYRRYQYRRAMNSAHKPVWVGLKQARPVRTSAGEARQGVDTGSEEIRRIRGEIDQALRRYDLVTAAERYLTLIVLDDKQVLGRRQQLDVANQLMSGKQFAEAAEAYEKYITCYPAAEQIPQVYLLLGIIYARHVPNPARAGELLQKALNSLTDPTQRTLCQTELQGLE